MPAHPPLEFSEPSVLDRLHMTETDTELGLRHSVLHVLFLIAVQGSTVNRREKYRWFLDLAFIPATRQRVGEMKHYHLLKAGRSGPRSRLYPWVENRQGGVWMWMVRIPTSLASMKLNRCRKYDLHVRFLWRSISRSL